MKRHVQSALGHARRRETLLIFPLVKINKRPLASSRHASLCSTISYGKMDTKIRPSSLDDDGGRNWFSFTASQRRLKTLPKSVNGIRSIFALHGCYQAFVHKYSLYNTRGSVLMNAD